MTSIKAAGVDGRAMVKNLAFSRSGGDRSRLSRLVVQTSRMAAIEERGQVQHCSALGLLLGGRSVSQPLKPRQRCQWEQIIDAPDCLAASEEGLRFRRAQR
jgi:hypothetical protein